MIDFEERERSSLFIYQPTTYLSSTPSPPRFKNKQVHAKAAKKGDGEAMLAAGEAGGKAGKGPKVRTR